MIIHHEYEEYWFVFYAANAWYKRFLKKDCSHLCVLSRDKFNWVLLDPIDCGLKWYILAYEAKYDLGKDLAKKYKVIYVKKKKSTYKFSKTWFGMRSCVTIVKYISNISVFSLTPYHFYKKLLSLSDKMRTKFGIVEITNIK